MHHLRGVVTADGPGSESTDGVGVWSSRERLVDHITPRSISLVSHPRLGEYGVIHGELLVGARGGLRVADTLIWVLPALRLPGVTAV